ncbi:mitogen-activated protein kinase kinase kinase 12/13 [Artemisia annua]|uniref:Mitogen-activated protein kinase kinase kinase 12/13 n=1 Tax=Artemisia annua TaxID=35608 RepID=A0A2U1KUB6_ARTAN|nr:mitogen-activated protein kinase kinase kinase 12/13 [Artemisia annua]
MNCLPCFGNKESESKEQEDLPIAQTKGHPSSQSTDAPSGPPTQANNQKQECTAVTAATNTNEANEIENSSARNFGFRDLAMATKNFRRECLLGESRVGKVYKGTLPVTGQVVAVKQLDRHGTKANKEFLAEVMTLIKIPLIKKMNYKNSYDYQFIGSMTDVPPDRVPLDWITRMKVASGAAQAVEYLHETANPPIICRNLTSTNILLDENLEPKLTDYGLVKLAIDSGNTMQQRIVSTVGSAPENEQNGELTPKSDVYSFGIVLLQLITGRKALDTSLPEDEQNLVIWLTVLGLKQAQPYFKDPKRFPEMADPHLKGAFPDKSLNQAVGVAAMCVQEDPSVRPMISDVVAALSFLTVAPPLQPQQEPQLQTDPAPAPASTNDPHEETRSSCSSSSENPEQDLEQASSDGTDDISSGTSSSENLYNEDDYGEDESQQEETGYRSKSKPKSIKRKVTFGKERTRVSRNSSKRNTKSFKTQSGTSLRKKSVNRKSSSNQTRIDANLSKKSHDMFDDHDQNRSEAFTSNSKSTSRSNKSFKTNSSSGLRNKNVDGKSSGSKKRVDGGLSKKSNDVSEGNQISNEPNAMSSSRRSESKKVDKSERNDSSFSSDGGK